MDKLSWALIVGIIAMAGVLAAAVWALAHLDSILLVYIVGRLLGGM